MNTTRLSSKGQVIIPKHIRQVHCWEPGQELVVINTGDGVLLKSINPFQETRLSDVASCLNYHGGRKTIEDMEKAIKQGVKKRFHDRD